MPVVPRVTDRSVDLRALPNAMQSATGATPDAFGANRAQAVGQLAQVTSIYAQRAAEREDLDQVFRAETALKTDYLNFERSELSRAGADAKGAAERTSKWWGEAERKYSGNLTSDRAQRAFEKSRVGLQLASTESLMRHEQAQLNKSLGESALARVQTAQDVAIADPSPERVALAREQIGQAVDEVARIFGHTPEIAAASKEKHLTLMHKGVIGSLLDREDPDAAKAYYYTHKKEVAGRDRAQIEKELEKGGLLRKSQEAADEIMGKFPDLAAAMAHVEKTYQGDEEKSIKHEVTSRFVVKDHAFKDGQTAAYGQGRLLVAQYKRVPQSLLSAMGEGHAAAILEHQEARLRAADSRNKEKEVKTDFGTYDRINRLMVDEPLEFIGLDLGRVQDKLSPADLKHFSNIQNKIKEPKEAKELPEVVTIEQQISAASHALKLGGAGNENKRGQLHKAINDNLAAAQSEKGKKLTYEERQKVIDQQIMEVTVPGFLWDSTKRAYEVRGTGEGTKAKIKVPDKDRELILDAFKTTGKKPTEEEILKLYKRSKGLQ